MAKLIARNVKLKVAGVDLSYWLQDIDYPEKWTNNVVTGMGSSFEERLLGIGDVSIACTFFQDYAASAVYATLQPLAGSNTPFEVEVTPDSSLSVGSTNPRIVMWSILDANDLVKGKVGEASTLQVTFYNSSTTGPLFYTT